MTATPPARTVDPAALRAARWRRAAELMERLGLDHLLVTGFDSIRYVSDYRTMLIAEGFDWFAAIVDQHGGCDLFVPWTDEEVPAPDRDLPWVRTLQPLPSWGPALANPSTWVAALAGALAGSGARRVGYELLYADLLGPLAQRLERVELVPVAAAMLELREIKEAPEIELLAGASATNSRAAAAALAAARPGMTDHEVLAVAMASMQREGAEYVSHSLCNVRRGTGTWFAAGNELRAGDAFFFDIGCYGRGGYASDMARTGFVGEPPAPVLEGYRHLLAAHRIGEESARPGVRASAVQDAVNGYLSRQRLARTPYAVGHGVGLRACELPTMHRADRMDRDQVLAERMVIALEPETAVDVDGRTVVLKVEDNYVVERGGLRRLTDAPYALEAG